MKNNTVEHIIKACLRHEPRAQKALYDMHVGKVYYIVLRYVNDKIYVEDILQEVFLKAFINLHKFNGDKASFGTWIRTISVRTALDHCRKKRIIFEDIMDHEVYQSNGEVNALSQLEVEDILKIIKDIPDKFSIVFNLYEIDGFNHNEIGLLLNITASTSRSYLTRAKKSIQKILNDVNTEKIIDK